MGFLKGSMSIHPKWIQLLQFFIRDYVFIVTFNTVELHVQRVSSSHRKDFTEGHLTIETVL